MHAGQQPSPDGLYILTTFGQFFSITAIEAAWYFVGFGYKIRSAGWAPDPKSPTLILLKATPVQKRGNGCSSHSKSTPPPR
jgi:hypothetical protein